MMKTRIVYHLCSIFILITVFGCYVAPQPVTVPIETIRYDAPRGEHRMLFVYLPGYGDEPTAFARHGFIKDMRQRGIEADIVAVNAHMGYYLNGSIDTRLSEDVIGPAKSMGYKQIWLVGNSLGAFGSLTYARLHPEGIAGLVLLGPFLGEKKLINQIRDAGGLQYWNPADIAAKTREGWEEQIWLWFKKRQQRDDFKSCREGTACLPTIYLGYGSYDRFSYAQKYLAGILPPQQVVAVSGGHDWTTWHEAWTAILDKMIVTTPADGQLSRRQP